MSQDSDNKVLLLAFVALLFVGLLLGGGLVYNSGLRTEEQVAAVDACAGCLSPNLSMDHQFADSPQIDGFGKRVSIKTVRQKLIELQAHCKDGKIYDKQGKIIRFYQMLEWGNPPFDHEKLVRKEQEEIERLEREGYTVIRMWLLVLPA